MNVPTHTKTAIHTQQAPEAIGTYSQAILCEQTLYLSGQIPLDPNTGVLVSDTIEPQIHQVFKNLQAVLLAANANFQNLVQLRVYLLSLDHFALVNNVMQQYVETPYPARAAVGVSQLPRGAQVEIEGIAHLSPTLT